MDAKIEFLRTVGNAEVEHTSQVPFLAHLAGTQRLLREWGARDALCDAGLFHSVYGTEFFDPQNAAPPSRDAVREQIGSDAEEIAWLWCAIERGSLDPVTGTVTLWRNRSSITMPSPRVEDIATLWAADTVEQIARIPPAERGIAYGAKRVVTRMLPTARATLDEALAAAGDDS